eukprot:122382-Chlamydomonas_euryale.AAC.2
MDGRMDAWTDMDAWTVLDGWVDGWMGMCVCAAPTVTRTAALKRSAFVAAPFEPCGSTPGRRSGDPPAPRP